MKKELILIVLAGLLAFPVFAQNPSDKNWQLVFKDDFTNDFTHL